MRLKKVLPVAAFVLFVLIAAYYYLQRAKWEEQELASLTIPQRAAVCAHLPDWAVTKLADEFPNDRFLEALVLVANAPVAYRVTVNPAGPLKCRVEVLSYHVRVLTSQDAVPLAALIEASSTKEIQLIAVLASPTQVEGSEAFTIINATVPTSVRGDHI